MCETQTDLAVDHLGSQGGLPLPIDQLDVDSHGMPDVEGDRHGASAAVSDADPDPRRLRAADDRLSEHTRLDEDRGRTKPRRELRADRQFRCMVPSHEVRPPLVGPRAPQLLPLVGVQRLHERRPVADGNAADDRFRLTVRARQTQPPRALEHSRASPPVRVQVPRKSRR